MTRMVEPVLSADLAEVSRSGLVRPRKDGKATLVVKLAGQSIIRSGDCLRIRCSDAC